jgi:hypothetical protein
LEGCYSLKFVFTTAMAHYPWAGSEELWGGAASGAKRVYGLVLAAAVVAVGTLSD